MSALIQARSQEVIDALSFGEPRVCLLAKDISKFQHECRIGAVKRYDNEFKNFITIDNEFFGCARLIKSAEELDNFSVDILAENMKLRLSAKRKEGRCGWHQCSKEELTDLLTQSLEKGNPVDIANFCAFLFMRGFDYEPNNYV